METKKLKIGQDVFFMRNDLINKGIITGKGTYEGIISSLHFDKKEGDPNVIIKYYISTAYSGLSEDELFLSKDELITSLNEKFNNV